MRQSLVLTLAILLAASVLTLWLDIVQPSHQHSNGGSSKAVFIQARSQADSLPSNDVLSDKDIPALYKQYSSDLRAARKRVRTWAEANIRQGIGDVEAEILYLRLRVVRPALVAELGFGQGLATTWMLQALHDNQFGHLFTFDPVDSKNRHRSVSSRVDDRWTLVFGDARQNAPHAGFPFQYVHSDAEHTVSFANWLLRTFLPAAAGSARLPVSFHDVFVNTGGLSRKKVQFSRADTIGCSAEDRKCTQSVTPEGKVVLDHINRQHNPAFSIAKSAFESKYALLMQARTSIGLTDDWISIKKTSLNNPSVFFQFSTKPRTRSAHAVCIVAETATVPADLLSMWPSARLIDYSGHNTGRQWTRPTLQPDSYAGRRNLAAFLCDADRVIFLGDDPRRHFRTEHQRDNSFSVTSCQDGNYLVIPRELFWRVGGYDEDLNESPGGCHDWYLSHKLKTVGAPGFSSLSSGEPPAHPSSKNRDLLLQNIKDNKTSRAVFHFKWKLVD